MRDVEKNLGSQPSWAINGPKEFVRLAMRYALWGGLFSLLVLGLVIVAWLAVNRPFKIDSFLGERFGRVLSGDVERKKLAEPIGVIDEVMLQTEGDPSRRLNCIHGYKYLGDVSEDDADRLAEEACVALEKLGRFELKECSPRGREGFRKAAYWPCAYALVEWDDNFFQKGKVLRLYVGVDYDCCRDSDLNVTEIMGYKIGEPVGGNGIPRTPFWKFERIVNQCDSNKVVDGVYAVHDVSALSLEDATREFEEAREAVERLHGIKLFKSVDYDDVKIYEIDGNDVNIGVKLEYLDKKQIRYSVLAQGSWLALIHAVPYAGSKALLTDSGKAALLLCVVVFCGGAFLLLKRRGKKAHLEGKDADQHPVAGAGQDLEGEE